MVLALTDRPNSCGSAGSRSAGFTFIELLATLAICGLVVAMATPTITHLIKRNQSTVALNWLVTNVVFARQSAVLTGSIVTLCPSRDGMQCGGDWHDGTIVFTDAAGDRRPTTEDQILRRFETHLEGATITWRSFGNRPYLQFRGNGFTNWQNGNFVICQQNRDLRYARQLVINLQGRSRSSKDIDNDGLIEDHRGRHLRC